MRESESIVRPPSKASVEHSCKFGTIVRALWPEKPALNLAQRIGCTERAAQFYIDGERSVTLDAWLAVIAYCKHKD